MTKVEMAETIIGNYYVSLITDGEIYHRELVNTRQKANITAWLFSAYGSFDITDQWGNKINPLN